MLERLAADGLVEAGIYAQAYRIIDAGNSFAFLYAGMLLPIFARMIDKNKPSELSVMINQAARFLIMPAGIAAIVVLNHSEWMMAALYDYEVAGSSASFFLVNGVVSFCLRWLCFWNVHDGQSPVKTPELDCIYCRFNQSCFELFVHSRSGSRRSGNRQLC